MAVNHRSIRKILAQQDARADNSLRAKSLDRALGSRLPITLTPYEWEQWYAEHGVPESHVRKETNSKRSWWPLWRRER